MYAHLSFGVFGFLALTCSVIAFLRTREHHQILRLSREPGNTEKHREARQVICSWGGVTYWQNRWTFGRRGLSLVCGSVLSSLGLFWIAFH